MLALLRLFVDICLFQAKPQDLPTSRTLVVLTALAALAGAFAAPEQIVAAAIRIVLLGAVILAALSIRGVSPRWQQTISAIYGTSALIGLIALPAIRWYERVKDTPELAIPAAIVGLLSLWSFAVTAHILRHALDISFVLSLLVSLLCMTIVLVMTIPFIAPLTG